ncbi:hypothetical protein [Aeromonas veronii]|uniref:hypothetical protein n=1 Tax=Aeromonas TaxID=642 RepID=UPI0032EBBA0C
MMPINHKKMRFTQITMQTPARNAAAAANEDESRFQLRLLQRVMSQDIQQAVEVSAS